MSDAKQLTQFERRRVQMEYVVPLIRDLQRLLGETTVNEALAKRLELEPGEGAPGEKADFSLMETGTRQFAAGDALRYEILASDQDSFAMDVKQCAYARMMEELDARDIGHLLLCNNDFRAAAAIGMELARSETIMQGGARCDFRYRRRDD